MGVSAKDRLRVFLEENIGRVIEKEELREAAGNVTEWARRVRELRDEEGMQIHTHNDDVNLKPGQYKLVSLERLSAVGRAVSPKLRNLIFERNGFTCQLCGAGPGDRDPNNPKRKIRLHIDHIVPVSQGGTNSESNLRVMCSACNQARGAIQPPSETAKNLIMRIRRQPVAVQHEIYETLKRKFGG